MKLAMHVFPFNFKMFGRSQANTRIQKGKN